MTDEFEAEPLTIEEVEEDEARVISDKMAQMRTYRTKPKPKSKRENRVNATKTCNELGFDPAKTLALIAMNRFQELGHTQPIAVHTMASAATTLLHATSPSFKPVDFIDTEEKATKVLTYIPGRSSAEATLEANIEKGTFEEEPSALEDNSDTEWTEEDE